MALEEANSRRAQFLSLTNKPTITYSLMCNKGTPEPTRSLDSCRALHIMHKCLISQTRDVALNLRTQSFGYMSGSLDLFLVGHMPSCPKVTWSWFLANSPAFD